ncbi:MAG: glycosyltransferase family 39 protein [Patescibacteria group bacterium]
MFRNKKLLFLTLTVIIAAIFNFAGLGHRPLEDYDEATYASVLQNNFKQGDFFSFRYLGENWFEKPPLLFWLAAVSVKAFGFNEFALRFPSALFGLLTAVLLYLLVLEITKNENTALIAGVLLVLMPPFTMAARNFRMDVPVAATLIAAAYFLIKGWKNKKFLLGVFPCVGLGIMLKSVIGIFALPILIIWSAVYKKWNWLKDGYFWIGAAIAALITAPWHIYMAIKFGSIFWQNYLGYHILERAAQNILGSGITVPYFLWVLWIHAQPLLILLIFSAIFITARLIKNGLREEYRAPFAAAMSAFFLFGIFALTQTKLLTYFTPIYPFLVALFAAVIFLQSPRMIKWILILVLAISLIVAIAEIFWTPKLFITDYAYDEKSIGELLKTGVNEKIFVFDWQHPNTIRYYSEQSVEILQFNTSQPPIPPFWLVIPTVDLEGNSFLKNMKMPFSGKYLSLIYVSK